jgi:hypothetical protein
MEQGAMVTKIEIDAAARAIRDSEFGTGSQEPWEDWIDDATAALEAAEAVRKQMAAAHAQGAERGGVGWLDLKILP